MKSYTEPTGHWEIGESVDTFQDRMTEEERVAEDGMLAILPILARLSSSEVTISDGSGRCVRRVGRDGSILPYYEHEISAIARAVSSNWRPRWEEDELTGKVRVAFPVGDRIIEIMRTTDSQTAVPVNRPEMAAAIGMKFDAGRVDAARLDSGLPAVARREAARNGGPSAKYSWDDIVGGSEAAVTSITQAKAAARGSAPVFLTGESGTGKELFAQAIHNASSRRNGPFIAINCSTLPDSLAESTLFGYEDGTFTGARKGGRAGLFEQANGGTLLLDEITEVNVETQAKLLRVIQEREVCRLGSVKPIPVDIRIVSTSNRDLHRHMRDGLFREDLYYRLNVIDIHLPPLRERWEDIPSIVESMIGDIVRAEGRRDCVVHPQAMDWLMAQSWPGNIRELRNVIERAVHLAEDDVLLPHHFMRADAGRADAGRRPPMRVPTLPGMGYVPGGLPGRLPYAGHGQMIASNQLSDRVAQTEELSILDALQRNNGHRGRTAAELGISVTTLWRRMRRIGVADDM